MRRLRESWRQRPLAQVLVRRGLADPDRARAFLHGGEEHAPRRSPASARRWSSILAPRAAPGRGSRSTGTTTWTASAPRRCWCGALRELGADVDSYLPDRATDGYGSALATVRRLAARGTRLLVTVDCGVTRGRGGARRPGAGDGGGGQRPPRPAGGRRAAAGADRPSRAVRVSLPGAVRHGGRLQARPGSSAARRRPRPAGPAADLDLVALATVADVVPLLGENRELRAARACGPSPGRQAGPAGADGGRRASTRARVDERAIGFALAPRLNAAGRLYRADAGLELILTEDPARAAADRTRSSTRANRERRAVERRIRFEAEAQMAELGERAAYVLAAEGWHPGVIGIVASRLVEQQRAPGRDGRARGGAGQGLGSQHRGVRPARRADAPARSTCCASAATARRPGWRWSADAAG